MSDWAGIKAEARAAVHAAFAVPASYVGPRSIETVTGLSVRWHAAGAKVGDLAGSAGYAEIVTATDKVIFDKTELARRGLALQRNGRVTLTLAGETLTLRLDVQAESDGPVVEAWQVTRE